MMHYFAEKRNLIWPVEDYDKPEKLIRFNKTISYSDREILTFRNNWKRVADSW